MTNEKYANQSTERDLVDTLEHIDGLEGIFLDLGDKRDARHLLTLYNHYLEIAGFEDIKSSEIIRKRNDITNYLSKVDGSQSDFYNKMSKRWKS